MEQQQISPLPKVKGPKFVVAFVIVATLTAVIFCYGIYTSYMTRPKIKIEDEKK